MNLNLRNTKSNFVFFVIASIFFGSILFAYIFDLSNLLINGIKTTGTITEVLKQRTGRSGYNLSSKIEYRSVTGEKIKIIGPYYSLGDPIDKLFAEKPIEGKVVNLIYLQDKPQEAKIYSLKSLGSTIVLGFIATVICVYLASRWIRKK